MLIECGLPTVWDLLKCAVTAMKRPVGYAMSSKGFADGLREEVGKLDEQVVRVGLLAQRASNNCRDFYPSFTKWEANAKKNLRETQDQLDAFDKASKTCCYGTLPDPKCRYQFSKDAEDKIEVIKKLARDGSKFKELNDICSIDPAPGNVPAANPAMREGKDVVQSTTPTASVFSASTSIKRRDDDVFESRASVIQEIMDALANNSNMVVGVHGMGGIGKSTLLAVAEERIKERKLFHLVTKADVSENPDIKRIQGEIAHWLGLSDIKEEENVSLRANLLRKRLENELRKEKKVLIILDNLWEQLDLKSVGIPCGHDNKVRGCKLLLTSRDQRVLRREMRSDCAFPLGVLKEEEAKTLFEKMVGGKVQVELEPLVEEALRICAGLPFLIVAIAKLFIDTRYSECKDALKQIWNEETGEVINKTLRISYDRIKCEEAKSLLRLCVADGVPYPSLEYLVWYGVGLKLFGEDSSLEEARNRLSSLIGILKASSLLLDDEDNDEDADGFKIHDLVRGFVTTVVSRDHPLLILKDDKSVTKLSKDKLKICRAICFPYVDLEELPEELDCPELQIFLLFSNNKSLTVSDSYFNSMRNLMVLHLTNIGLSRSPLPFQFLENLHSLFLVCCSLEDVTILGELKGLQILSLGNSNIQRLPKEIGQLTELRLLNLDGCSKLQTIEPGVLGSLMKLEELYMDRFGGWNALDQTSPTNASLIELNNMKNLCTLHVSILNPSVLPEDLNLQKLTKYRIKIGRVYRWDCKGSSTLELQLDPTSDILQKGCIQSILGKTDDLFLDGLDGIEQSICALSSEGFPKLKHLHVKNSPFIHYILQSSSHKNFRVLESLHLENLINLENICSNNISSESFHALKEVRVERCNEMEILFPHSMVRELSQLEEIKVVTCELLRGIIEVDDDRGKFELPKLRVLKLHDLPNIENFIIAGLTPDQVGTQIAFFNGQQVSMPSLESLTMEELPNLNEIWSDDSPLELSKCRMLTEVISDEGSKEGHAVAFLNLKCMELDGLIRLRCFSSSKKTLSFPLLEDFIVTGCPNMKFFSEGPIEASKLERVKVSTEAWFWKGNLNATIQNMFEEMSMIVGERSLRMSKFPKLIEKWHSGLSLIKSSWQLRTLVMDKCPSFINAIPSKLMFNLEYMMSLQVRDCDAMEEIFDLEGLEAMESTQVLPCLADLDFVNLPKLRRLWNKDLQGTMYFDSLSILKIYNCSNLGHAFTPSMARCLANLSWIKIKECGKMEGVIADEGGKGSVAEKITFPRLDQLELECLPNLTSFLSVKNHTLECPKLEKLTIAHCPKMRSLTWQPLMEIEHDTPSLFTPQVQFLGLRHMVLSHMDSLRKIWTDDPQETLAFHYLGEVETQNCKSLDNLFPHWVATSLTQLKKLRVESCGIKEIVANGDDTLHSNAAQVLFPELTSLVLHDMPRLKSFYPNLPTSKWPFLKELRVTHCDKLSRMSFAASMSKWTQRNDQGDLSTQEAHSSFERDFLNLERILLFEKNIQMIQDGKYHDDIFGKSKALTLACFHDEKAVFPPKFLLERFQNLQNLEVFCSSFEDIFPDEGTVDEGEHPVLESLRELKLSKLHKLKRVWKEDYLVSKILRSIKTLEVWDCPDLMTLFPTVTSFQNLTKLVVMNSSGLIHLGTASAVTNLVCLTDMTIIGCERMKEVMTDDGHGDLTKKNDGNGEEEVISLENLERLTLQNLPSLVSFSSTKSRIMWLPSLWRIEVEECPKMKIFSEGGISTPKLQHASLFRYKWVWDWEGDLNTTIQELSA